MTWSFLRASSGRLILVGLAMGAVAAVLVGARVATGNAPRFPNAEGEASAPARLGPDIELTRGEYRGTAWALSTYDSSVGPCVTLSFAGAINAEGESCGANLNERHVGYSQVTVPGLGATWLFGPTRADVDRVDVTLRRGGNASLPTVTKTADDGTSIRYFVAVFPGEVVARTVVARDQNGRAMSTREIDLALG